MPIRFRQILPEYKPSRPRLIWKIEGSIPTPREGFAISLWIPVRLRWRHLSVSCTIVFLVISYIPIAEKNSKSTEITCRCIFTTQVYISAGKLFITERARNKKCIAVVAVHFSSCRITAQTRLYILIIACFFIEWLPLYSKYLRLPTIFLNSIV